MDLIDAMMEGEINKKTDRTCGSALTYQNYKATISSFLFFKEGIDVKVIKK